MKRFVRKIKKSFSFNYFFIITWAILLCVVIPLCSKCEPGDYGEDLMMEF